MNKFFGKIKGESGQALVIVAASLVVLLGVTAFSVDLGMAYNAKAVLQAAADAGALAGAQEIPEDYDKAELVAIDYALKNGAVEGKVFAEAYYAGNPKQIEVVCEREFEYLFARILGFDKKTIRVRAVAERGADWRGESIPFINLDDAYVKNQPITLWEKTDTPGTAGDYERLWGGNNPGPEYVFDYVPDPNKPNKNIAVACTLTVFANQRENIATTSGEGSVLKTDLESLLTSIGRGATIYILSLDTAGLPIDFKLGTKTVIDLNRIQLLQCRLDDWDLSGSVGLRGIDLTYLGNSYSFYDVVFNGLYVPGYSGTDEEIRLVK